MIVITNLKKVRINNKISQQKLADEISVSRSTIAMWETGGSQPDNDNLMRIADYFNVTVDYLLGREEKPADSGLSKEPKENVIIYHRNGKTVQKEFTKEEMNMLATMIDSLKGVQNSEDL